MAGFLSKIEKIVDTATTVNSIYTKLNSSGLLSGINLNNIDPKNLGSIGNTIQSNVQNIANGITGDITSSFDTSEIENIAKTMTPEELGVEMPDMSSIQSQIESEMSNIQGVDMSEFNVDTSQFDFSGLDFSDLENISFG